MTIEILKIFLPIVIVFLLGMAGKKWNWFDASGSAAFRSVIGHFMLPAVVFDAFLHVDFSGDILLIGGTVYVWMILALGLGFLLRRRFFPRIELLPFFVTLGEIGMLGYSLIRLLFGAEGAEQMAICDLGNTGATFTLIIPLLRMQGKDSKERKAIIKDILTTPTLLALLSGIILGLCGFGKVLDGSAVGPVYQAVIDLITGPTTVLILLSVGYDLYFDSNVLRDVFKVTLLRVLIMGVLGTLSSLLIFSFVPFNKVLLCALILCIILPCSYCVPIYAPPHTDSRFSATMISVSTLLGPILYIGLTIFAL